MKHAEINLMFLFVSSRVSANQAGKNLDREITIRIIVSEIESVPLQ